MCLLPYGSFLLRSKPLMPFLLQPPVAHQICPSPLRPLAMMPRPTAHVVSQLVSLSSFLSPGRPNHREQPQQHLHARKGQLSHQRHSRKRQCCTHAAQSMVDALGGKGVSTPQRAWWTENQELWAAVHTPEELDKELQGNGKDLVVVGETMKHSSCSARILVWAKA